MLRHRNFQSVIGPLTLEAAFYSIFTFNFRFNRALISHSGAMLRHRNFQSVIGPLTLEAAFYLIFFFQAEDGIRDAQESRGLGDVYKRQLE